MKISEYPTLKIYNVVCNVCILYGVCDGDHHATVSRVRNFVSSASHVNGNINKLLNLSFQNILKYLSSIGGFQISLTNLLHASK